VMETLHFLRQQKRGEGQPNHCLADYVAPKDSGKGDYLGVFACSTGFGVQEKSDAFKKENDDYHAIMVQVLADRLAEAFAELLHQKVRREYWGYAEDEELSNKDLIKERYQGIRPAAGYPAVPDHTEKGLMWDLLGAKEKIGLELTEHYAMYPTAAVSGLYFAHPDSKYFTVGKIEKDQVEDYAKRKGMSVEEVEKWLATNLGYDA